MAGGGIALCRLDEIADPGARGFAVPGRAPLFVVRKAGRVFAYANACPHRGTPLDWKPDSFLTADASHLVCATHGALFRIADGVCVAGPCPGRALVPVAVRIVDGLVVLAR